MKYPKYPKYRESKSKNIFFSRNDVKKHTNIWKYRSLVLNLCKFKFVIDILTNMNQTAMISVNYCAGF